MGEDLRPEKFVEDVSDKLEEVLENPHELNYRHDEEQILELYPDHLNFREAEVDQANQNVTLRTNLQAGEERYTAVLHTDEYSLVESLAEVCLEGKTDISVTYYLVTDEETFMYDGSSWEEKYNPAVEDVDELVPELYRQAKKFGSDEIQ